MLIIRPETPEDSAAIRNVNQEAFMALELRERALSGRSGIVEYQPEFNEA